MREGWLTHNLFPTPKVPVLLLYAQISDRYDILYLYSGVTVIKKCELWYYLNCIHSKSIWCAKQNAGQDILVTGTDSVKFTSKSFCAGIHSESGHHYLNWICRTKSRSALWARKWHIFLKLYSFTYLIYIWLDQVAKLIRALVGFMCERSWFAPQLSQTNEIQNCLTWMIGISGGELAQSVRAWGM